MSEIRWHPVLGEWLISGGPGRSSPKTPVPGMLEIPEEFEIVSFENGFPSLVCSFKEPSVHGDELYWEP